ncbi:collagen alpha-1(I) chain-like isoform X1 [Prionailurus iriomotensis]
MLQQQRRGGRGHLPWLPNPMEQAAAPGGRGLPCSQKQALALYQHLFRCPAGLGPLQAALQQVQESRACPSGLELPAVLLEMEQSRRAQEQLLWDLELLTGAGLGLFWPPRAQFCGLRDRAQCAWSQRSKPRGGLAVVPSSALDLGEAASHRDPRRASPALPAESTPGTRTPWPGGQTRAGGGCLQELNPTTSFGDPGSSEFKNLAQRAERRQAGPTTQRPCQQPSVNVGGRKLTQGAPRLWGLPSWGLPEPQVPLEGLGWSLGQERAELQKLLRIEIPQRQREGDPQEQKEESPQGQRGEAPQGESKEVPSRHREKTHQGQSAEATQALREEVSEYPRCEAPQSERRESPQGQRGNSPKCQRTEVLQEPQDPEMKTLQTSPGPNWEVAEGEVPTQPPEEGGSLGISRDPCRSLGEQMPQQRGRESPGSGERAAQRRESAPGAGEQRAAGERVRTPLPPPRPPTRPLLPSPGAETLEAPSTGSSGQQESPAAPRGHPGLVPDPHGLQDREESPGPAEQVPDAGGEPRGDAEAPKASKSAWPWPPGREKASAGVSAVQQETALQRLLELHRAARRRRRQDREQQRLRVLECLRIARNRHCRVHPLGPPPSPAQLQPQSGRTRRGSGEPCGSSCNKCIGRGPGGCGPSGPGTPRTSSSYCGLALRTLCQERSPRPSQPHLVIAESSKG